MASWSSLLSPSNNIAVMERQIQFRYISSSSGYCPDWWKNIRYKRAARLVGPVGVKCQATAKAGRLKEPTVRELLSHNDSDPVQEVPHYLKSRNCHSVTRSKTGVAWYIAVLSRKRPSPKGLVFGAAVAESPQRCLGQGWRGSRRF